MTSTRAVPAPGGTRHPWRLHGHRFDDNPVRLCASEAIGTAVLVLAITATASASDLFVSAMPAAVTVPLAVGFAQAVVIACLGHISGAHVNPAVTVGLAVAGRFPWRLVPGYLVAQLGGAVAGAALTWAVLGSRARTHGHLGSVAPGPGTRPWQVFLVEAVVTFVLVLVVVAVGTDARAVRATSALTIGVALAAGALVSGPVSGGGINPARSIGPMLLAGRFPSAWAYVLAPLVGGSVAVLCYDRVLRGARLP